MVLLVLSTEIEAVQDLALCWLEILQAFEEEPNVSSRRLALRMNVSSFTTWRTLHEQGFHPYHLQGVQHLKPKEPPRRIVFCQWLLASSIGRNGPVFWPARSPDLNPCDFFLKVVLLIKCGA
jgi:hypothetical protein